MHVIRILQQATKSKNDEETGICANAYSAVVFSFSKWKLNQNGCDAQTAFICDITHRNSSCLCNDKQHKNCIQWFGLRCVVYTRIIRKWSFITLIVKMYTASTFITIIFNFTFMSNWNKSFISPRRQSSQTMYDSKAYIIHSVSFGLSNNYGTARPFHCLGIWWAIGLYLDMHSSRQWL